MIKLVQVASTLIVVAALSGCACFLDQCGSGSSCGTKSASASDVTADTASASVASGAVSSPAAAPVASASSQLQSSLRAELRNVFFDVNKSTLNEQAKASLNELTVALKKNPGVTVVAAAFCDSKGNAALNERLGAKRAESVKQYLVSQGIPSSQIQTQNQGAAGGAERKVELQFAN